jgi:hypothetical protein
VEASLLRKFLIYLKNNNSISQHDFIGNITVTTNS